MRSRVKRLILAYALLPMTALADSVILLHGLARSDKSMQKMERVLTERG